MQDDPRENFILRLLIGAVILFLLSIGSIVWLAQTHAPKIKTYTDCPDYPPVDGAGRPDICK